MIQAEIGGAARVLPGIGVQSPGFMIRDFTLTTSSGEKVRISSFRGRCNLAVVFLDHSDGMSVFLEAVVRRAREFSCQDATVLVIAAGGPEERVIPIPSNSPIVVLYDKTLAAHRLSGATDENARPIPLIYLTDRFGEIVSTYVAPVHPMPPSLDEILSTLEFINQQCPECEPPEWPR